MIHCGQGAPSTGEPCQEPAGHRGQHKSEHAGWMDAASPSHYADLKPEPIDVITAWGLNFCLGNVVKYVSRAGRKGVMLEDLKKAKRYLEFEIARLEKP